MSEMEIMQLKMRLRDMAEENFALATRIEELEAGLQLLQDGWVKNEIPAGTWAKVRALLNKEKKE